MLQKLNEKRNSVRQDINEYGKLRATAMRQLIEKRWKETAMDMVS